MERYIVIAEEGERSLIAQHLPGCNWPVIVTGVGALNVIQALQNIPRDAELLNIGYAGSSNFAIGTLVEVTEVRLNHPNVTYPEPTLRLQGLPTDLKTDVEPIKAVCYSNTDFVLASDYKDCAFDMELAYIAALGFKHLTALKHVSDNLSLHTYHEHSRGVE